MVDDRLNSCGRFRRGQCRHQNDMARLYLIPQILDPKRLVEYEKTCSSCRDYVPRAADGLIERAVCKDEPRTFSSSPT